MCDEKFCAAWDEASREYSGQTPEYFDTQPLIRLKHLKHLLAQLPPVIARKSTGRIFGGAVSPGTLANDDSRGKGPRGRFKIGRTVVYPTIFLLEWMEKRGICPQVDSDWRLDV